jgi:hypothetical protein
MTLQELAQKARAVASELEAAGWDYDDARLATMALASGGILDEMLQGASTPAIDELKAIWSITEKALPVQRDTNSKDRVELLKREALRILDESNADITQGVAILPLAKQLMAATDCGIDAAKRRIAEAIRRKRGEHVKATTGTWGGKREGAGRPRGE